MLWNVADINADLGDAETAAAQFEESLTLFIEFGDRWFCGIVLESAAFLAAGVGDAERAVRLLGAADAIWAAIGVPLPARFRDTSRRAARRGAQPPGRGPLRGGLGRRQAASRSARRSSSCRRRTASAGVDTAGGADRARESRCSALVATGLTDAEVAERLVVSIRTVHAHLRSIYRKLDVHTRSAATRYALEHDLVT